MAKSNIAFRAGSSSTKSSFTSASRVRYESPSTAHFLVRVSMLVLHNHLEERKTLPFPPQEPELTYLEKDGGKTDIEVDSGPNMSSGSAADWGCFPSRVSLSPWPNLWDLNAARNDRDRPGHLLGTALPFPSHKTRDACRNDPFSHFLT